MYFTKNLDPSQSHEEKNSQCNKIVFCIHTFIADTWDYIVDPKS